MTGPARSRLLPGLLGVGLLLGAWELAPRLGLVNARKVPPVSTVAAALPDLLGEPAFRADLAASAVRWGNGIVLAVVAGVLLGSAMGRSRTLFLLGNPLLVVLYAVPKAALVLVLVLMLGPGDVAMVAVIVAGAVIPVVISTYHAVAAVDRTTLRAARGLGWTGPTLWLRLFLPAAAPGIASGVRIAVPVSLFTLIASELLIRRGGVGSYLFTMLDVGQFPLVWAATTVIALVGFALDMALVRAVRAALPWHRGDV